MRHQLQAYAGSVFMGLSLWTCVIPVAAIQRWDFVGDKPASSSSAVFGEWEGRYPDHVDASVELLRYVTAYRTGLETLVDMTPYSPLLRNAAKASDSLAFYNFIDTWVGNGTGSPYMYMDNVTKQCTQKISTDGNGWSVSADLIFWPDDYDTDSSTSIDIAVSTSPTVNASLADTRPRATITLASGTIGSDYPIGTVSLLDAHFDGDTLHLKDKKTFQEVFDADVFDCSDTAEIKQAAFLGQLARGAERLSRNGTMNDLNEYTNGNIKDLMWSNMMGLRVEKVFHHNNTVRATYDTDDSSPKVDMNVYYAPGTLISQNRVEMPIGKIFSVDNGTLLFHLNGSCLPKTKDLSLPGFLVQPSNEIVRAIREFVHDIVEIGKLAASNTTISAGPGVSNVAVRHALAKEPLLLRKVVSSSNEDGAIRFGKAFEILKPFGNVVLGPKEGGENRWSLLDRNVGAGSDQPTVNFFRTASGGGQRSSEQERPVCVIARARNGHVFDRHFIVPHLGEGERVVAQLAVTGHGWATTTEQCGEFCRAVYSLAFNDGTPLNVTQFRNDCKRNPIGEGKQFGTWYISRNGWCPGSVEPGLFIDVTKLVRAGSNQFAFNVRVQSDVTGKYEPYTDFASFASEESASLSVALTLFVYDRAAVTSIFAQDRAYTAAEAAIRRKPIDPSNEYLRIPSKGDLFSHDVSHANLKAVNEVHREATRDTGGASYERFDFEARAPWYLYNSSEDGHLPAFLAEAARPAGKPPVFVDVFRRRLVQSNTRTVISKISGEKFPKSWRQVALYFRLEKPHGRLDFDHWDRQASFGLFFGEGLVDPEGGHSSKPKLDERLSVDGLLLRPAHEPKGRFRWPVDTDS
eukprot:TRINITY_DN61866_c0_g1_i1.p1 TRINITY_DN61866_c0_g1~~TRINITY_DN61866_c0_g1_i1.p1  ORF type:complete len:858 (-),score=122.41 TRINITY_DN61866_c0_g1_i1:127-2700(-)